MFKNCRVKDNKMFKFAIVRPGSVKKKKKNLRQYCAIEFANKTVGVFIHRSEFVVANISKDDFSLQAYA